MLRVGPIIVGWLASVVSTLDEATDDCPEDYVSLDYTDNCTNVNCTTTEDYVNCMFDYIFPKFWDWVLIATHSIVFLVGLVGNALVCIAVYRNHSMRTVTNYFIVNLAVADFLVLLLCLPFTVLWDITETWFFGLALCKAVPYLQVSRSSLTSSSRGSVIDRTPPGNNEKSSASYRLLNSWQFVPVYSQPVFRSRPAQGNQNLAHVPRIRGESTCTSRAIASALRGFRI